MSSELERLVREVLNPGATYAASFDRLCRAGSDALPPVLDAVSRGFALSRLSALLSELELDDVVGELGPLARSKDRWVRRAAIAALGASGDPRAFPVLREAAGRSCFGGAVEALAELGMPEAIPVLQSSVKEILERTFDLPLARWLTSEVLVLQLNQVVLVAGSLARLGEMGLAHQVQAALTSSPDEDSTAGADLRLEAVLAMDAVVAPGSGAALRLATGDADRTVAEAAVDALVFLGRREDAGFAVEVVEGGGPMSGHARRALTRWSGEMAPATRVRGWWESVVERFEPGICYHDGLPVTPRWWIDRLGDRPGLDFRLELKILTGARCVHPGLASDPVTPRERAKIEAWWTEHASELPAGRLLRWGRAYAPDAVD